MTDDQDERDMQEFKAFKDKRERERIMAQLKIHGIAGIEVSFSGSGDDGNINSILGWGHKKRESDTSDVIDLEKITLSLPENTLMFQAKKDHNGMQRVPEGWVVENGIGQVSVYNAVERLFWMLDDHVGIDWVNDDGGHGTMTIDVDANEIKCEYYAYETTSNHVADYVVK